MKSTILYIDDDYINVEVFKGFFEDKYDLLIARSASEGYELLKKHAVKVIVSDHRMPVESGLDFLLRIDSEFPNVIKIVLTAFSEKSLILQALNTGIIYRYLLKPWKSDEMEIALVNAVKRFDLVHKNQILLEVISHKNKELSNSNANLRLSEQKFSSIFNHSNDAIYILHPKAQILEANQSFFSLVGFSPSAYPVNYEQLSAFVSNKAPVLLTCPIETVKIGNTLSEVLMLINDGEGKFLELNCKIFDYIGNNALVVIVRDLSERKKLEHEMAIAVLKAEENERMRYARELHDGLGPILSAIKMFVEHLSDNTALMQNDIYKQLSKTVDEGIACTREISTNLSPNILKEFGLKVALQSYIEKYKSIAETAILLEIDFDFRLPEIIEFTLYRVLLECINNAFKHARAKKILLSLLLDHGVLVINYHDDGIGIRSYEDHEKHISGMGLANIQYRIRLVGGQISFQSVPEKGTSINMLIPISSI